VATIRDLVKTIGRLQVGDLRDNPRIEAIWKVYRDLPARELLAHSQPSATKYVDAPSANAAANTFRIEHPHEGLRFEVGRGMFDPGLLVHVYDAMDSHIGYL
jgi:hypothetical protein